MGDGPRSQNRGLSKNDILELVGQALLCGAIAAGDWRVGLGVGGFFLIVNSIIMRMKGK